MNLSDQFHNIERLPCPGCHVRGTSRTGRLFRVTWTTRSHPPEFIARALTPRDDMVNEIRGPSLASISNQLEVTP